jgi:hypothetical protein
MACAGKRLGLAGALALLSAAALRAQPGDLTGPKAADGALALAAKIDERLARHWKDKEVQPAPLADDAEFVRRVCLDLIGRIPSAGEARHFLADKAPDKRQRLVETLLASPRYALHWMNYWEGLLLPERKYDLARYGVDRRVQAWLRKQLVENVGYDRMARELLTAPLERLVKVDTGDGVYIDLPSMTPFNFVAPNLEPFYFFKKATPENLTAFTTRLFLGVRLECAQCHDHPFAQWKRHDFWSQAAFFASLEAPGKGPRKFRDNPSVRTIAMSDGGKQVPARFLDGTEPKWPDGVGGRRVLADWITSPSNPYFARAIANRLWAYFLGTGLIEPIDEMVGTEVQDNDPGGVLDELAQGFVAHGCDLKFLMRAITATKAYQRTSARSHPSQDDPRRFARMSVRGLTSEQLFDSLAEAIGYRLPQQRTQFINTGPALGARDRFLVTFANLNERAVDTQSSIPQALAMMNGEVVADATGLSRSRTLTALLDLPLLDTAGRVEALYLATLSRRPRPDERQRMLGFIAKAGGEAEALADIFWVLLNSAEFKVNH